MLVETLAGAASAAGFMAWAVRGRSSRVFGPSVWRGARDRRSVALTFDDGPSEATLELVELITRLGVRATFFVSGTAAERLPDVARSIRAAGHEIGSHGYSHAPLYLRGPAFVASEIERAQQVIRQVTGIAPKLYRPAYGCRWFGMGDSVRRLGLTTVMWTVLGHDWKWPARRVASHLSRRASNGAIFCLHDGRDLTPRPDIRETLEAVRMVVPDLRARGYEFQTAGELLQLTTAR